MVDDDGEDDMLNFDEVEDELQQLENYQKNHPQDDHDPSSLELYCDENPDASECKIYDN